MKSTTPAGDWTVGDVLLPKATADRGLLWIVSARPAGTPRVQLVPFDPERLAGHGDLEIDDPGAFGAGTLRCRHACWSLAGGFEGRVCGRLGATDIDRMTETLARIASDTLVSSPRQLETSELPEYDLREAEVRSARADLLAAQHSRGDAIDEIGVARPSDPGGWIGWRLAALVVLGFALLLVMVLGRALDRARQAERLSEATLGEERRLRQLREQDIAELEDRIARFEQGQEMATLSGVPVVWLSPRPVLRSTEDSDTLEVSPRSPGWVMVLYVPHSLESEIPLKLIVSRRGDGSPESELSVLPMTEREVSVVIPRDRLPAGDYWLDLYQGDERLAEYSLSITTVAKPE